MSLLHKSHLEKLICLNTRTATSSAKQEIEFHCIRVRVRLHCIRVRVKLRSIDFIDDCTVVRVSVRYVF